MRVLVLDVGNSNMKCAVFSTDGQSAVPVVTEVLETSRGNPWDMVDKARNMITRATAYEPDIGIVTAFGDAFVDISGKVPRYVFADEPAVRYVGGYEFTGMPAGMAITGIRSLRKKHHLEWTDILPVNMFVLNQLTDASEPHLWDKTQASVSGEYHLLNDDWLDSEGAMLCDPSTVVTRVKGLPLCAGGLDNAFIDIDDTSPYVIAGTWRVVGAVAPDSEEVFTHERRNHFVRGLRSATGKLHLQTVRRSVRGDASAVDTVIADLEAVGAQRGDRVRFLGGYASELAGPVNALVKCDIDVVSNPQFYQLAQAAKFVYARHANTRVEGLVA